MAAIQDFILNLLEFSLSKCSLLHQILLVQATNDFSKYIKKYTVKITVANLKFLWLMQGKLTSQPDRLMFFKLSRYTRFLLKT